MHALLPFSLLLALFNILPVKRMAATYEAAGVASAAGVMFWGALWHFTAGILLPALATGYVERCERRQFLKEEADAAQRSNKAASYESCEESRIISPFVKLSRQVEAYGSERGCYSWQ